VLTIESDVKGPMNPAVCGGAEISCVPEIFPEASMIRTPHE